MAKKASTADLASELKAAKTRLGNELGELLWRSDVATHDYPSALNYLSLLADEDTVTGVIASLKKAAIVSYRANDILRAARLDLLPLDDPSVKRDLSKVLMGQRWSPVLIVRGDIRRDAPLTVADGYHRICASYHLSEDTYIPCQIVDLPALKK